MYVNVSVLVVNLMLYINLSMIVYPNMRKNRESYACFFIEDFSVKALKYK